jgi:hypothetical protein
MLRVFDLLLMLYPAEYRMQFGEEMRAVFVELDRRDWWLLLEYVGLVRGALRERRRHMGVLAGGAAFASVVNLLLYWYLLPIGVAHGQTMAKQNPSALELARSIYSRSFTALREAKTLDELRKLSDDTDAPEWISVDRFGRTVLTKKDVDRDLENLLKLTPERRAAGMDIIWAEKDAERLIVVAWMMPNESHGVTRGTLIRDIFVNGANGWRRVRHDKITPNDMVLAVDGKAQVLPPMDEEHRVHPR